MTIMEVTVKKTANNDDVFLTVEEAAGLVRMSHWESACGQPLPPAQRCKDDRSLPDRQRRLDRHPRRSYDQPAARCHRQSQSAPAARRSLASRMEGSQEREERKVKGDKEERTE